MFKIAAIVSLLLIATCSHAESRRVKKEGSPTSDFDSECQHCGSTLWAASLSCDSCGSECAAACGTRHFRSCCFNYLRKKRGQDNFRLWSQNVHDMRTDSAQRPKMTPFLIEDIPPWSFLSNDLKPYQFEDSADNRLQFAYDV